jgi:hypothetical protein
MNRRVSLSSLSYTMQYRYAAGQPRRDIPLWVLLLLWILLTLFYVWLDRVDREYTAELAAEAVIRRLRNGET